MDRPNPFESRRSRLDYFVHATLMANHDSRYRSRVLAAGLIVLSLILIAANLALWFSPVHDASKLVGAPISVVLLSCHYYLLQRLRRRGDYFFCSMAAVTLVYLGILAAILTSGGVRVSPASQIMVVPPLMAYFFGGLRWGNIVALAVFLALVILASLEVFAGVTFPQTVDMRHEGSIRLMVFGVAFLAVCGMAWTYEYTARALKRERDIEHRKVIELAQTDPLTQLANRRSFDTLLEERLQVYGSLDAQRLFALCYIDLDGFKMVNDQFGHDVGDEVLKTVAARLRQVLRDSDAIGRHGGDEFTLVIDPVRDMDSLEATLERLDQCINKPIETSAGIMQVGVSIGAAIYPRHGQDAFTLKRAADQAMYSAKRKGHGWSIVS